MGGVGCISVTANVAPKLCSQFQQAMREGRWDEALEFQDRLYPLHAAFFQRRLARTGQICAGEGPCRLPGGIAATDDRAVGRVEARGR